MVLTSGMVFVQRGRPAKDHRTIVNVILWVLPTGAFRCDLPERFRERDDRGHRRLA
jgi:transposase